jgi:ABC-type multidrug transport system ATPase subunit
MSVFGYKSLPIGPDPEQEVKVPQLVDSEDPEVNKDMQRVGKVSVAEDILQVAGLKVGFKSQKTKGKWWKGGETETKMILGDLWLSIRANECYGFLGPNGSGKTSTIGSLIGTVHPQGGYARIGPYQIVPHYNLNARSIIAICLQFDVLWNELTVLEHFRLFTAIKGNDPNDASHSSKIDHLLEQSGLDKFKDIRAGNLSGGNKRKISLVVTALGEPKLIFLDGRLFLMIEPTTGIDVAIRRSIWDIIMQLKSRSSIILTTHSMEEAEFLSDRIGILGNGKLQCVGTSARLKAVYGCGYQVQVSTVNPNGFIEYFLEMNDKDSWMIARQIGNHLVFQRTPKGMNEFQEKLNSIAMDDNSKKKLAYNEIQRLYSILESANATGKFGEMNFNVEETTLGEVFEAFEKKHNAREL